MRLLSAWMIFIKIRHRKKLQVSNFSQKRMEYPEIPDNLNLPTVSLSAFNTIHNSIGSSNTYNMFYLTIDYSKNFTTR